MATDADTCTFNDRIIPFCSITTHVSSTLSTSASIPSRSRPKTSAVFLGNSKCVYVHRASGLLEAHQRVPFAT